MNQRVLSEPGRYRVTLAFTGGAMGVRFHSLQAAIAWGRPRCKQGGDTASLEIHDMATEPPTLCYAAHMERVNERKPAAMKVTVRPSG